MVGGRLEVADGPCGVLYQKYALSTAALGQVSSDFQQKPAARFVLVLQFSLSWLVAAQ